MGTRSGDKLRVLSCKPCRERKVRCDRLVPCESCIRHNREAECESNPSRRIQRGRVAIARVSGSRGATQRPPASPAATLNATPHSPTQFPSPRSTDLSDQLSGNGRGNISCYIPGLNEHALCSVGSLHAFNNAEALKRFRESVSKGSVTDYANSVRSYAGIPPPANPSFGITLSGSEVLEWQVYLASALPPRTHCDLFVSYFFENINWIYQAVHAPSFYREYAAFWETRIPRVNLIWLSLLYIMMSASALHISPAVCEAVGFDGSEIAGKTKMWYRLSRQSLDAGGFKSRPCLVQIQTFIISQFYWYATKNVEYLNSSLGHVVRAAQAIGLDKDCDPSECLETELRHRIWWDLCSADTYQSLCLDRQPLIQAYMSRVPFPLNCDDTDLTDQSVFSRPMGEPTVMSTHIFRARLFKAISRLYFDNGSLLSSYEFVSNVDREILAIMDDLPWYCQLSTNADLPPSFHFLPWQHHVMHNSICIQRIRMYRPFLRSHFEECYPKCINAAESAFAVYHSIRANPKLFQSAPRRASQSYQLVCSAISIAVFLLVERPPLAAKFCSDLEIVLSDLKSLADEYKSLAVAVDGTTTLAKILDIYHQRERNNPADTISLIPEIYTIMGGKARTKTYLDRCAIPYIVNGSNPHGPQQLLSTPPNASSPSRPPAAASGFTASTSERGSMLFPLNDCLDAYSTHDLNDSMFNLPYDVLNWDIDDFAFPPENS